MGKKARLNRARRQMSATVTPMIGGGQMVTVGTGQNVVARDRREITDVPGEHLWAVFAAWKVDPEKFNPDAEDSGFGLLDHENILTIGAMGCFKCERPYSKELAATRCNGSVTDLMP